MSDWNKATFRSACSVAKQEWIAEVVYYLLYYKSFAKLPLQSTSFSTRQGSGWASDSWLSFVGTWPFLTSTKSKEMHQQNSTSAWPAMTWVALYTIHESLSSTKLDIVWTNERPNLSLRTLLLRVSVLGGLKPPKMGISTHFGWFWGGTQKIIQNGRF